MPTTSDVSFLHGKAEILVEYVQMPADQSEVPDFLKKHGIRASNVLFDRLCGHKKGDCGVTGLHLLGKHSNQAQNALSALLALYGFHEDVTSAFEDPVSYTQLPESQSHESQKPDNDSFGHKPVTMTECEP